MSRGASEARSNVPNLQAVFKTRCGFPEPARISSDV
jgi:hypothetical protein